MAKRKRLDKRQRAAVNAPRDAVKAKIQDAFNRNLTSPRDPQWALSRDGSSASASNLMVKTHQKSFRDPLRNRREQTPLNKDASLLIDPKTASLGRVEAKGSWRPQAPLPTDHKTLLSLERHDKVMPVVDDGLPLRPMYATSKVERRFGKTK